MYECRKMLHHHLQRFFSRVVTVDAQEREKTLQELQAKLPARGKYTVRCRFEHEIVRGVVDDDEFRALTDMLARQRERERQCATFISFHVLQWLYTPKRGPMFKKMQRDVATMTFQSPACGEAPSSSPS